MPCSIAVTLFIPCPSFSWWLYLNSIQHQSCFLIANKLKNIKSRLVFHTTKQYQWAIIKELLQSHNEDQPCPCLCSIITFNTIPPGNKSTAPPPPPDSPLPPLSIRPLKSSTLSSRHSSPPLLLDTSSNPPPPHPDFSSSLTCMFSTFLKAIVQALFQCNSFVYRTGKLHSSEHFCYCYCIRICLKKKKKRLVVTGIHKSWSVSSSPTHPLP